MDNRYTPLEKQSKKAQKAYNSKQRVLNGFNTGTRTHNTDKHPSRAREKDLARKRRDDWER